MLFLCYPKCSTCQKARKWLDEQGIAVRGGLHCAPGVHRFLGTLNIGAVRVSPGLMNTAAEAGKLIDAVWKIAKAR